MATKQTEKYTTDEILTGVAEQTTMVQHQINNPLAVVLGNVQFLLLKGTEIDPNTKSRLKVIESAALKISDANKKLTEITLTIRSLEPQ